MHVALQRRGKLYIFLVFINMAIKFSHITQKSDLCGIDRFVNNYNNNNSIIRALVNRSNCSACKRRPSHRR